MCAARTRAAPFNATKKTKQNNKRQEGVKVKKLAKAIDKQRANKWLRKPHSAEIQAMAADVAPRFSAANMEAEIGNVTYPTAHPPDDPDARLDAYQQRKLVRGGGPEAWDDMYYKFGKAFAPGTANGYTPSTLALYRPPRPDANIDQARRQFARVYGKNRVPTHHTATGGFERVRGSIGYPQVKAGHRAYEHYIRYMHRKLKPEVGPTARYSSGHHPKRRAPAHDAFLDNE